MFLDFLTDESGATYEYGHCHADGDNGSETGCGMEYAYYAETETLKHWHDAVGLVTTREGFTVADRDALEDEHDVHTADCDARDVSACYGVVGPIWHGLDTPARACERHADENLQAVFDGHHNRK